MSINLSEDAVHALNRSAAAAARDGEEAVAPIHVLAGCLSEKHGTLVDALEGIGLATEDLPSELLDLPRTYEGHLPFTPESHDALAAAVEFGESRGRRHDQRPPPSGRRPDTTPGLLRAP